MTYLARRLLAGLLVLPGLIAASPGAETGFPASSLRVIAVIDGTDELHISPSGAKWVHKGWSFPTDVRINGQAWNPHAKDSWTPPSGEGILRRDLDLAGVVLHTLRGRGTVKLGRDSSGLVITFDDPENGADTYEVALDFAEVLLKENTSTATDDLRLSVKATIDGNDDVTLSGTRALWTHTGDSPAKDVTVNGQPWDTVKTNLLQLPAELTPETFDLQKATVTKLKARGTIGLDYQAERLYLAFDDPASGAGEYDVVITAPRFARRNLVRVETGINESLEGAALKIYRAPDDPEVKSLLAGQRVFDADGKCLVALEPGSYRFEVLHRAGDLTTLVALKTSAVTVVGPTNIDLKPITIHPGLIGPEGQPMSFDELSLRSSRRSGDVTWKAPNRDSPGPTLILSPEQNYKLHAFGHADNNYVAVWKTSSTAEIKQIALDHDQWLECAFHWRDSTPLAVEKGVDLQFPDGTFSIPNADKVHFFTNRRFFSLGYWLELNDHGRAVFQPQGQVLTPKKVRDFAFGGGVRPLASAAILKDEGLGGPNPMRLWSEITLGDAENYILDTGASKIHWASTVQLKDGGAIPPIPFTPEAERRLGNLKDTLVIAATCSLNGPLKFSTSPQLFVPREFQRFSTQVPAYRTWNTANYFAKAERELNFIFLVRQQPSDPKRHIDLHWWLNSGAVGGGGGITMPFPGYLESLDWYSHPWAIAHEMLHCFGYGHTHEMNRLDNLVQERMEYFRWYVADHPEYVP